MVGVSGTAERGRRGRRRIGEQRRGVCTHLDRVNSIFASLSLLHSNGVSSELIWVGSCLKGPASAAGVVRSERATTGGLNTLESPRSIVCPLSIAE